MTLDDWVRNGWLRAHTSSEREMRNLFAIVDRERADAATTSISLDARLGMLYNAALRLADIALRHCGYRAGHERQHYRVIMSLPFTLGNDWKETTRFLERIQKLRHRNDYESVGLATRTQVDELGKIVEKLQTAGVDLVRQFAPLPAPPHHPLREEGGGRSTAAPRPTPGSGEQDRREAVASATVGSAEPRLYPW